MGPGGWVAPWTVNVGESFLYFRTNVTGFGPTCLMSARYSPFASGCIRVNGLDNAGTPPRTIAVVTFSTRINTSATMIGTDCDLRCPNQASVNIQPVNARIGAIINALQIGSKMA